MFTFCTYHLSRGNQSSAKPNPKSSMPLDRSAFSDRYRIHSGSMLGTGHYGSVYKVQDRITGEEVAVKTLKKNRTSEVEVLREASLLSSVEHPNLVGLKGVFEDSKAWHIVMELARGEELFNRLVRRGLLGREQTRLAMQQLVLAAAHLHAKGIVHADIKPENCILEESDFEGSPLLKLADFGSAFSVGDGVVKGGNYTASYSPPEVVSGEAPPSFAGDVWSLGVVACILLTGSHPFDDDGETPDQILAERIIKGEPSFNGCWSRVDPSVKSIILKALSKDPRSRPTACEMLNCSW